jgi:hypothetical protein
VCCCSDQFAELKQKTLAQVFPVVNWAGFDFTSGGAKYAWLSRPAVVLFGQHDRFLASVIQH